ncbi:MAG: DUF2071 domain-containing protein [Crocinitomicaceae bacterium]|nr:DUF2071 domain-containing protein [Crocinitomicaceae bacterium]
MSFLNAEWRKLIVVNYEVPTSVLEKYVPKGTQLDLWNGKCYLSLVGFMFLNTKILGIKIPFHINFEEVNLRFYVKRILDNEERRGVVFIKEIVPKAALSFVANTIYKEHYETMPMSHSWEESKDVRTITYNWKKKNQWHNVSVIADVQARKIVVGSDVEFITEHYWGYSKGKTKTNEYEVTHPTWEHYPVQSYEVNADFGVTYGEEFQFLNDLEPSSVMLAEGSEITVEGKTKM